MERVREREGERASFITLNMLSELRIAAVREQL